MWYMIHDAQNKKFKAATQSSWERVIGNLLSLHHLPLKESNQRKHLLISDQKIHSLKMADWTKKRRCETWRYLIGYINYQLDMIRQ